MSRPRREVSWNAMLRGDASEQWVLAPEHEQQSWARLFWFHHKGQTYKARIEIKQYVGADHTVFCDVHFILAKHMRRGKAWTGNTCYPVVASPALTLAETTHAEGIRQILYFSPREYDAELKKWAEGFIYSPMELLGQNLKS